MSKSTVLFSAAWLALLLFGMGLRSVTAADLELALEHPTRGEAVEVRLTGVESAAGVQLTAAYRPGSATEVSETVGIFGSDGVLQWSPTDAGLSVLSANSGDESLASRNVSIRFDSTPPLGMLILLLAGLLLFGGTTVMLRRALEA